MSTQRTERWQQLLSPHRVGDRKDRPPPRAHGDEERTAYDVDYDRIVFSSAFRSLHDKTQVFPLSASDYTRTRLTHSIEASSVGRSLGQLAGRALKQRDVRVEPPHLGTIVAAACLAHDIGNPPFGHSGEAAIQHWVRKRYQPGGSEKGGKPPEPVWPFATESEQQDLMRFEGNAQGFRILTRLQARNRDGGLRYTVATVGAMSKYPRPSVLPGRRERDRARVSEKKFGFFQEDAQLAREVYRTLGLAEREPDVFSRHPLAFLVEAADDICYALIDLEDSAKLGLVPMEEACSLLESVAALHGPFRPLKEKVDWESRMGVARAGAISTLIQECVAAFEAHVEAMEAGRFEQSLVSARPEVDARLEAINGITRKKGYESERVLQIEAAGFKTLGGLLDMFAPAVLADEPDLQDKKLRQLLPLEVFQRPGPYLEDRDEAIRRLTPYQRLLCVTDYVSAMTDGFAVELYQRLSGIKLPE